MINLPFLQSHTFEVLRNFNLSNNYTRPLLLKPDNYVLRFNTLLHFCTFGAIWDAKQVIISRNCAKQHLYYTRVRCSLVYFFCFLPLVPSPTRTLFFTHYGAIYRTKFDGSLLIFSVDIRLTDGMVVSSRARPGNVLSLIVSKLSSGLCCQYGTKKLSFDHIPTCLIYGSVCSFLRALV